MSSPDGATAIEMTNRLRSAPVKRPRRALRVAGRAAVSIALIAVATFVGFTGSSDDGRTVEALDATIEGAGGEYHPLTPKRILDTREPAPLDVAPLGRKSFNTSGPESTFNVPIVGRGGLPAFVNNGQCADQNVLAVAVNVTVVDPAGDGWLRAYGKSAPEGGSSVVNFKSGETTANTALLRPGCDGELSLRLYSGTPNASAHVLIDVFGWISSSAWSERGARLEAAGPGRIFDSREAPYGATPFAAGQQKAINIRGTASYDPVIDPIVPSGADVTGVLVNITAVNNIPGSQPTYISVLPSTLGAGELPSTSNLNLRIGQIRSNLAIVPITDGEGRVWVYNHAGNAHVVLDVMGYFVQRHDNSRAGRIVPLVSPFRAFDTRESAFHDVPLPPANAEDWSFADFVGDVKIAGEPVGPQSGLIGNLTAAGLARQYSWAPIASWVAAYPTPPAGGSQTPPFVSNLGLNETEIVPNLVMLAYGEGTQVRFYNRAGYLDYLLDVTAVVLA